MFNNQKNNKPSIRRYFVDRVNKIRNRNGRWLPFERKDL